ncbi:hypothetical protein EYR36_006128 [Pleurotus pulmonarius]|nr:hypothetical protein EYR36_006128 [Pleurotus pulmonarius]KAF4600835.1 hypothetical protein EYR38_005480 [Pleurotus pulmonarius]
MPVLMTSMPRVARRQALSSSSSAATSTSIAATTSPVATTTRTRFGFFDGPDDDPFSGDLPSISSTRGAGLVPTLTTTTARGGLLDPLLGLGPTRTSSSSSSSATSSVTSTTTSTSTTSTTSTSDTLTTSLPTESTTISVFESSSNGQIMTITSFVQVPAAAETSTSASGAKPQAKGFLDNKPLSGVVFALCGLAGLILIIMIATCAMRRRQRKKLMNEAISFDPANMLDPYSPGKEEGTMGLERTHSTEKRLSVSSSGHGHGASNDGAYGGVASTAHAHTTYGVPALTYGSTARQPQYHQATYAEHQTAEHHGYYGHDQSQEQWYGAAAHAQHGGWQDQAQYPTYANYGQPEPPSSAATIHPPAPPGIANQPPYSYKNPPSLPQLNFIGASPPASSAHAGILNSPILASARRASSMLTRGPATPTAASVARSATVASSAPYSASQTSDVTRSKSTLSHETDTSESGANTSPTKHGRSHSRELDPAIPTLPLSPMLPATFGRSDEEDSRPDRGSVHDDARYLGRGPLKIANE